MNCSSSLSIHHGDETKVHASPAENRIFCKLTAYEDSEVGKGEVVLFLPPAVAREFAKALLATAAAMEPQTCLTALHNKIPA